MHLNQFAHEFGKSIRGHPYEIRDKGRYRNKAVCTVLALNMEGQQSAWIAGRHEAGTSLTAMYRRPYDSTTEYPGSVS